MYFVPKYFNPYEIFSKKVIKKHSIGGVILNSIWRLMDSKTLWTADKLREEFGSIIINDYSFKGNNQQRGFRDPMELIDLEHYKKTLQFKTYFSSFTSQHCFGRALDMSTKKVLVKDARTYIIKNKKKEVFKYITAIEKKVSWLHFDTRNFKKEQKGFLLF